MADMGKVAPRGCSASSTTSMWFDRRHQQVSLRHHTQCCCESSTCVHFLLCLICAVAAARLLQEVPSTFSKIRVLFPRCAGALLCPHCCNRCWKVLQSCWPFRRWPRRAAAPNLTFAPQVWRWLGWPPYDDLVGSTPTSRRRYGRLRDRHGAIGGSFGWRRGRHGGELWLLAPLTWGLEYII